MWCIINYSTLSKFKNMTLKWWITERICEIEQIFGCFQIIQPFQTDFYVKSDVRPQLYVYMLHKLVNKMLISENTTVVSCFCCVKGNKPF